MQIKIKAVSVEAPAGKKYQVAEVIYADGANETKTKKLMSFANPATYAVLKDAVAGEVFEITQVKNDKGFWDWTSASKSDGTNAPAATKAAAGTSSFTKSSYETSEERARRQVLIVKQSSLAQAIAYVNAKDEQVESIDEITNLAQQFADWVLADDVVKVNEAA